MRRIWRAELDIWRIIGDGKVVTEILGCLGVLLLRETRCILDVQRIRLADECTC
jgi:hypothetical protein